MLLEVEEEEEVEEVEEKEEEECLLLKRPLLVISCVSASHFQHSPTQSYK